MFKNAIMGSIKEKYELRGAMEHSYNMEMLCVIFGFIYLIVMLDIPTLA